MTALVVRSSFGTSVTRYARSRGLWLLLLAGPVGARFMVARDDGSGVQIAIGRHLPVMTSAVLGVSLGIVVSTLLLPIGFLYLRYVLDPRTIWDWLQYYIKDHEVRHECVFSHWLVRMQSIGEMSVGFD